MAVQPFPVGIHNHGSQILHIASFILGTDTDLLQRIPGSATGGSGRLEADNLVIGVLAAPTGGQCPQFAFQIGDDRTVRPR